MSALDTTTGSFTPAETSAWWGAIDRFRAALQSFETAAAQLQTIDAPPELQAERASLMQRARAMGPTLQGIRAAVDEVQSALSNAWDSVTGVWSSITGAVQQMVGKVNAPSGESFPSASDYEIPALYGLGVLPLIPIAAVVAATAALVAFVADYAKFAQKVALAKQGIAIPDEVTLTTKLVLGAVALGALWLFLGSRKALT